jgi:hypothetical protein
MNINDREFKENAAVVVKSEPAGDYNDDVDDE